MNKLRASRLKTKSTGNKKKAGSAKRFLATFIEYLQSECHLSPNTVDAYHRDIQRFCEWLGGKSIPKLTVSQLSDYVAWLARFKLAPSSIARNIVAVKMFFKYLQLEGVLVDNHVELLGSQKLWQRIPEVIAPKTIERFLTAPTQMILFICETGPSSKLCTQRDAASRRFQTCDCRISG